MSKIAAFYGAMQRTVLLPAAIAQRRKEQNKTMFLRLRLRLAALFPLGIAARLTLSFIAVAVLAATANLIARETISIIYLPPHTAPVAAAPVIVVPKPATHAALTIALQEFEQALQQRMDGSAKITAGNLAKAADALRHAAADSPALEAGVVDLLTHAQKALTLSDQRRGARLAYSKLADSLSQRLRDSVDGSWKIFGRVLARQSLVQLRNEFDQVRALSQSLGDGNAQTPGEREALNAAENAFLNTLTVNQAGLERSEGPQWVLGMGNNFAELTAARAALQRSILEAGEAAQQVSQSRAALSTATNAADAAANRSYAGQVLRVPLALPPDGVASAEAEEQAASTAAQAAARDSNRQARDVMATVTLLVMLMVIAISLATVRSVSAPVRRILEAARRLASGNAQVPVPRGGIRELDTLAAAFNSMASELSAAQQAARLHQATLENKVLERTHKLRQLAQQDPLTSLPNRRHLLALLNHSLENAVRENLQIWVYFIDLDNFKNFNDSEGHVFGDRVLMSVANRLEEIADGLGFVARLGGDEFTLVCDQALAPETVQSIGRRIVNAFQKLISVDQRELSVSVSIGASIFPEHGRDAESLLRAADSALFRAKELGRSQVAVFTPELIESAAARFAIEQGLRRALEARQFELHFQPEFSLATSEMALVEALLRWRMPDGRLARPGEFLAVAEQSGLLAEINEWVLRSAIEAAARWHHGDWPSVKVAINISSRQLMDPRFIDTLLELMREHRLPTACIELELTETVLQTGPTTIAALRSLHTHGFGIALDDFGTGYSSLTSLEHLPLSRIKLDRSLIASIDTSLRSAAIARAIIDLCAGLSLEVTAEGVERPQQLAWLMNSPALTVQGFLLSDSLPFSQVTQARSIMARVLDDLRLSAPAPLRALKDVRRATGLPVPLKHWR
jgi:diguanylate cyclase (GGDEF)-like protein